MPKGMVAMKRIRAKAAWVVGTAVMAASLVQACGETNRHKQPVLPQGGADMGGATEGETAGGAEGVEVVGGSGATSGGAPEPSGGAGHLLGGAAGESGAAGAGGTDDGLTLIPMLPVPETGLPDGVEAKDLVAAGVSVRWASADGSVLVGTARFLAAKPKTGPLLIVDRLVYWTEQAGTQQIDVDVMPDGACIADDGSAAFFNTYVQEGVVLSHWVKGEEPAPLEADDAYFAAAIQSCSGDAKRVALAANRDAYQERALYWDEEQGGTALSSPDALLDAERSWLWLSRDSAFGVLNASGGGLDASWQSPFRWSGASGGTKLSGLDNDDCEATAINGSGSVIIGACYLSAPYRFRWQKDVGVTALLPQGELKALSRDGSTTLGAVADETNPLLVAWNAQGAALKVNVDSSNWDVAALSDDGSVAYLNQHVDPDWRDVALRWERGGKAEKLAGLGEDPHTWVAYATPDGSLAVGRSLGPSDRVSSNAAGRPVLWDEHGVRDIMAELAAAGIDVSAKKHFVVERVWKRAAILLQGSYFDPDSNHARSWLYDLPLR